MVRVRLAIVASVVSLLATRSACASFADELTRTVNPQISSVLGQSLAKSIARSLPVISSSAGVVYRFDLATGAYTRETQILGQLFLERADTIGRNRLDFSVSYQRVKFDTFEGKETDALRDVHPIPAQGLPGGLIIPHFAIDLDTHQATANLTYGLTENCELNLTTAMLISQFGLASQLSLVTSPGHAVPFPPSNVKDTEVGIGDILLRGKYQVLARDWAHAALGLVLRLPAGNEDNFQGTGVVELAPMLYVSRDPVSLGRFGRLVPYLNAGVNFDTSDVDASEARWGTGLDWGMGPWFTAGVAVLGRNPFQRTGPPGLFDVKRVDLRTGQPFTAPLFGIEPQRPDYYDFSVGGRVDVWRDTVFAFANAIIPLNRDGFRADVIPLAGIEATF